MGDMGLQPVEQGAGTDILVGAAQANDSAGGVEAGHDDTLMPVLPPAGQMDLILDLLHLAGPDRGRMGAVDRLSPLLGEIGAEFREAWAALLRPALELGAELGRPIDLPGPEVIVPVADLADPLRLAKPVIGAGQRGL